MGPDALKIWLYFLSGKTQALFYHMIEDARSNFGVLSDFRNAIQFFLQKNATDEYL